MKLVILAGGVGTRINEDALVKPKPLIEIGGRPILWHIMKLYSHYGINEFIICLGYKGYLIKEYFANYFLHMSDVTFDMEYNKMHVHQKYAEPWQVTLVDTGELTMTGGRLKRVRDYIGDETFCFTYGDGVGDVDIRALIDHHNDHQNLATVTAVQHPGRFGALELEGRRVNSFQEKPQGDGAWINGGFFVLSSTVFDLIDGDRALWEKEPLEHLANSGQLYAYLHKGFWQPIDTLRDKEYLEELWRQQKASWKIW